MKHAIDNSDVSREAVKETIKCPLCGAPAGEWCKTMDDKIVYQLHSARYVMYRVQRPI